MLDPHANGLPCPHTVRTAKVDVTKADICGIKRDPIGGDDAGARQRATLAHLHDDKFRGAEGGCALALIEADPKDLSGPRHLHDPR